MKRQREIVRKRHSGILTHTERECSEWEKMRRARLITMQEIEKHRASRKNGKEEANERHVRFLLLFFLLFEMKKQQHKSSRQIAHDLFCCCYCHYRRYRRCRCHRRYQSLLRCCWLTSWLADDVHVAPFAIDNVFALSL